MTPKLGQVKSQSTNHMPYEIYGTYDYHPLSTIKSTLAEFYRDDEILMGKQVLAQSVDGIDGVQQFCKNRIGVNKVKASIDDTWHHGVVH